ncbi:MULTISPECIES: hypothetical protein [Ralstonia solanacearum species complex]|nr:hypothetical protein [Ralstonia solanacearum]BEU72101.1 hypothetical protein MAFF211271_16560 [Ralstonia pseudosolanacearum]
MKQIRLQTDERLAEACWGRATYQYGDNMDLHHSHNRAMADVDRYLEAAARDNTRRSYQSAIRHFEVEYGGFLPASADSVARHLADHAQTLSINTLHQRLAAFTQWHLTQGFPDPTRAPHVRKALKGIQVLHPAPERRAKPLQLTQPEQLVASLDSRIAAAAAVGAAHAL